MKQNKMKNYSVFQIYIILCRTVIIFKLVKPIFVIILVFLSLILKNEKSYTQSAVYRVTYGIKITSGHNHYKTFRICIPLVLDNEYQKIHKIQLHSKVQPTATIKSKKHGLQYYYFRLEKYFQTQKTITLTLEAEIQKTSRQITHFNRVPGKLITNSPFYRFFTRNDIYSDRDIPIVKKWAKEVQGLNPIHAGKIIFEKVKKYLKIQPRFLGLFPLREIIKRKSGECSDFSQLFTAVMRAAGIPARIVVGRVLTRDVKMSFHIWAEFYAAGYGWIPCDPFYYFRGKLLFGYQPEDYLIMHYDTGIPAPAGEITSRLPMLQTYYYFYNTDKPVSPPVIEYIWSCTKK